VVTDWFSLADFDAPILMDWRIAGQAKKPLSSMKKFVMLWVSHFLFLGEYHAIVK